RPHAYMRSPHHLAAVHGSGNGRFCCKNPSLTSDAQMLSIHLKWDFLRRRPEECDSSKKVNQNQGGHASLLPSIFLLSRKAQPPYPISLPPQAPITVPKSNGKSPPVAAERNERALNARQRHLHRVARILSPHRHCGSRAHRAALRGRVDRCRS